ncbi:MAG: transcription antitermination factor NusB [Spirochaetales bacterium]|nr:transcription antitermination factor NusB [Spirochaetales bacterium]
MGSRRKGRILAFQSLYGWEINRDSLTGILDFSWLDESRRKRMDNETITFSKLLVSGAIENIEEIDKAIKKHLDNWDFSRLNKVDLAILRLSVYSLRYQKEIPASVTIDEAINIAKEFGNEDSYRFVNGVLDGICRDHD